jgi:mono/diheme cytochrome c family protein
MNFPQWSLPAPGLLVAGVAIVHVFISHFAVGGGLFLVLAERKARRERDDAFLGYVRRHSRFFVLLTLVLGALTGVGIWFTIGLVHPQATASLINIFVWAWAIEWTMFATEIAAAMVYYHGWDRLDARTHVRVGWIYAVAAWLSLVVINGILSFMMTPGLWLSSGNMWAGLVNPTFPPSVVVRTLAAFGLAGVYALVTGAGLRDAALKEKVAVFARPWVLWSAALLPLALTAYLVIALWTGIPIGEPLGGSGAGIDGVVSALLAGSRSGNPVALNAVRVVFAASTLALLLAVVATTWRRRRYGLPLALATFACAFAAIGAGEWVREDLRKPYVIGRYMFVNGVREPRGPEAAGPSPTGEDRFALDSLQRTGVLRAALWTRLPPGGAASHEAEGAEVFRLLCTHCHTIDGHLGIRKLVAGRPREALVGVLAHLDTWRGRKMPPFAGNAPEREAVAYYLARLGGAPPDEAGAVDPGRAYFAEHCAACHGPGADVPIGGRGRTSAQIEEMLGRLPAVNEMMPPFTGTEAERKALAGYVASLPPPGPSKGGPR